MNSSQKRFFEWPILLLCIWLLQAFEISLSRVTLFNLTAIQVCPVIILYLSLTRDWAQLAILATVFAYIGTSLSTTQPMISISVYLWTAFLAKILVITFALENRGSFTILVLASTLFAKVLYGFISRAQGLHLEWSYLLGGAFVFALVSGMLAFLLFPIFVLWDKFFEHNVDGSRDLNPVI